MPKADGSFGNCYRVSWNGQLHGYFPTERLAINYANWYNVEYAGNNITYTFTIEKWFIEGEF